MKRRMLSLIVGAAFLSPVMADVRIETDRAVIDQNSDLTARVCFPAPDQGDLYVAARIDGVLYFYGEDGRFSPEPVPYRQNGQYDANQCLPLFTFPGDVVPGGRYILYSIVTDTGADPYEFARWHGPLALQLFITHEPPETSGDHDGDGWPDDDANRDGFSDMDHNFDGWRDDDMNHDGIPDAEESGGSGGADHDDGGAGHDDGGTTGGGTTGGGTTGGGTTGGGTMVGESLYSQKCASCHGQDPATGGNNIRRGIDPTRISNAITANIGGMGFLANQLTNSDIQAIADFIRSRTGG